MSRRTAAPLAAMLLAGLALAGCQKAVLDPVGPVGIAEKSILIGSVVIMLAIVLPVIAATLGFAWWFRDSNTRARYLPDWSHSGKLEMVTWSIPLMTIILLGGVAWIGAHELDPAEPLASDKKPLEIEVVSLDWKWLFIYPDQHVASVNTLTVPAGVPLHFSLTSASVMNAFFIPRLGSMIYTMNGMVDQLNLMANEPGTYPGLSSHYSGDGFATMHFDVQALPQDGFDAWVAKTRGAGPTLDQASYATLAKQSLSVAPMTYGNIDPALFGRIVSLAIPPAPGPDEGRPNPSVSPVSE